MLSLLCGKKYKAVFLLTRTLSMSKLPLKFIEKIILSKNLRKINASFNIYRDKLEGTTYVPMYYVLSKFYYAF